ncbi:hypothetical protein SAMN05660443_1245 [Marinospirillum celere]|uniref:Uncharacterized protein n=1 Tax=Marinospirillum celere TaxID=1122252 RepID=A0A1I1FWB0_9GAMM|nr:hypothetical protein [Marinospirillum celere]SFC03561.1 hypothetical protein SAMN05660443_1245 [Marinospirillum celere]
MIQVHGPLLERLLAGEFICPVTDEDAFRHLQDESTREAINDYLKPLNRRLASNPEGSVWFLAWLELTGEARDQLSGQLALTLNSLQPLLEWMQLVQEALGKDAVISAGDVLKPAEFTLKCEDNASLKDRLQRLASDRFFNSQSDALDNQVKLIFRRLKEHGYLLQPHSDRQFYLVTSKVDYLIDLIRFIRDEENLPIDQEVGEQEELL